MNSVDTSKLKEERHTKKAKKEDESRNRLKVNSNTSIQRYRTWRGVSEKR